MAKYEVTAPDGSRYEIEAPDGASESQVMDFARSEFAKRSQMTHKPGAKPSGAASALKQGFSSRLDKLADGIVQSMHADDEPVQRGLAAMSESRKAADRPVQEANPLMFGIGDAAPLLAVPGGQKTALGRIAAPAAGAALMEGLSFGSPYERATRAGVAGATGAAGGLVGEGLTALMLPRRGAPGLAPDVADAVSRNNFPLSASQRSGSPTLGKIEDYLSTAPGAIGRMQGLRDNQQDILNTLAARSIGQKADVIDKNVLSAARDTIGNTRNALKARVQVSPVHPDLITGVRDARQVVSQMAAGPQSLTKSQASAGASIVDDLEDFIRSGNPMDGDTYQTWRTAIREAKETAYDAKNSKLGETYNKLQKALDKAAQGSFKREWQLNDQQYAALQIIEKGQATNEATGNVNPRTLANNFMQDGGATAKEGGMPGDLADIALLAKGVPEYKPGSPTASRQSWQNLLIGSTAGGTFVDPGMGLLMLGGIPGVNNLAARALTRQGAGLTNLPGLRNSPVLTDALREQLQRLLTTGAQGAARGTVTPGLAVPL